MQASTPRMHTLHCCPVGEDTGRERCAMHASTPLHARCCPCSCRHKGLGGFSHAASCKCGREQNVAEVLQNTYRPSHGRTRCRRALPRHGLPQDAFGHPIPPSPHIPSLVPALQRYRQATDLPVLASMPLIACSDCGCLCPHPLAVIKAPTLSDTLRRCWKHAGRRARLKRLCLS
jgi:hypothetical protein